jgi:hypothetical protein
MSFRNMAIVTAIVTFVLGAGYLIAGEIVVGRWQIEPTVSVLLLGKRIGALYLGLSIIFFLARSAPVSVARTALSAGTAVAVSLLSGLSIYEFAVGHAAAAILLSATIEALLAVGYVWVLFVERKDPAKA